MWPFNKKTGLTEEGKFHIRTYFSHFTKDLCNKSNITMTGQLEALTDFSNGLGELSEGASLEVIDDHGKRVKLKKVNGKVKVFQID